MSSKKFLFLVLFLNLASLSSKEQIIRDASWSNYTYFVGDSFYTLMDSIYDDKITLLEEKFSGSYFIFNWLAGVVPSKWNINISDTTVWNYDPFDALYIGIQGASSDIVQASIDMLPISKAIIASGKTTDIRGMNTRKNNIPLKGKVDISQYIKLNYDCMDAKICKSRASKVVDMITIGGIILGITQASFIKSILGESVIINLEKVKKYLDIKNHPLFFKSLAYSTAVVPLVSSIVTHRLQNSYMSGYIKNFEILTTSDKLMFDKSKAKEYLTSLIHKIKQFGFGQRHIKRLQAILATL